MSTQFGVDTMGNQYYVHTESSGILTIPAGYIATVVLIGGGAGAASNNTFANGGGSGGFYVLENILPGDHTYTIGAPGGIGQNGGSTSLDDFLTQQSETGGDGGNGGGGYNGSGGNGGDLVGTIRGGGIGFIGGGSVRIW